jgi:ketosteroid isomerase-like protein
MSAADNKAAVMRCIELFNQGTLEWVDTCFSTKLEWIELPTPGNPQGRQGDFSVYRRSAAQLLRLFPDRTLTVLKCVADETEVVLDQLWQGTAAMTVGNFVAGKVARQRVASFFTLEQGLIVKAVDYCAAGQ